MYGVVVYAVLLAALVSRSQEHAIGNHTCGLKFQEYIKAAIAVKRECASAVFDDCCQVHATVYSRCTCTFSIAIFLQIKTVFNKASTGVYQISEPCKKTYSYGYVDTRCDMDRGNGGWLVIQRRVAGGTEDFYRGWSDYEEGFGDLEGEFWYGLKNIHCLTNRESVELRFDLEDEEGNKVTRTYQEFRVEGPENKYRLHIGGGDTPAGVADFMAQHSNMYFSTKDRDNDMNGDNCALAYKGGWWYESCHGTNPNGLHHHDDVAVTISVHTTASHVYYPNYEIKIRPTSSFPPCD